jgi:hypothetical protein
MAKSWEELYGIFQKDPPETLYHYTDQKGLLGILSEKEIWLTHTQYLNDSKEFRHAISLAKPIIQALKGAHIDAEGEAIVDKMLEGLDDVSRSNVLVCSFSSLSDDLSQWRAYCDKSGFAIGFPDVVLRGLASPDSDFHLGQCIYFENEQRALVKDIVDRVFEDYRDSGNAGLPTSDRNWRPNQLLRQLRDFAPLLKDKAFAAENEWRLITRQDSTDLNFRQGSGTLIPYYRKSLLNPEGALLLDEVVVGPSPYSALGLESLESLLVREQFKLRKDPATGKPNPRIEWRGRKASSIDDQVPTRISTVPYRNW